MNLCGFEVGLDKPVFLISGPCVAESEQMCLDIAGQMKEICAELGIPYIFKLRTTRPTAARARASAAMAWTPA